MGAAFAQSVKNNNALTIQSVVCNCFNTTKRSFCVNMGQWTKYGSTTSFQSQISYQLSGQQQVKAVQSDQRLNLEKERTINSEYYIALLVCLKEEIAKNDYKWRKKVLFSPRQCAPCHKLITMMTKLHELHFELLPHPHPILQIRFQ